MSAEDDIRQLREEVRALREAARERDARVLQLERALGQDMGRLNERLLGEDDPKAINEKLRRLNVDTGTSVASSSTPDEATEGGELAVSWSYATPSQKLELLRAVVCGILASLNGRTIECNGDGTITMTLPNLPTDACSTS